MVTSSPVSLQEAIRWVNNGASDPDALVRLQTASALVQGLADLGDATLGYFVDQARHDGRSWSEIGDALGVSKQAVQQKHTVRVSIGPNTPTFEHLTPRARRVVSEAEEIARSWGHGYVGTEHLLLALYLEPEGIGAQILVGAGLSHEGAESAVAARVQRGMARMEGDLTFTPRAVAVLSAALSSALAMNHNYIGTEHLLLGLVRGDGVAAAVLRDGGLTGEMVAQAMEAALVRYVAEHSPTKAPRKGTAAKSSASKKKSATATKARRR
jgi:Clp amino terminal domain, pathogenicity island component